MKNRLGLIGVPAGVIAIVVETTARVLADPFGRVLVLQVEDSGPGIAESERELVFEPFYRVLGNEADGSGLVLPIVRASGGERAVQGAG